jgi:hypothetical protein
VAFLPSPKPLLNDVLNAVSSSTSLSLRLGRKLLFAILLAVAISQVAVQVLILYPVVWARNDLDRDTLFYYTAAERVRTGEALYWPWPEYGPHFLKDVAYPHERHPYPPFVAPALAPLTVVPVLDFVRYAYIPLIVAFWVYAACLVWLARRRVTVIGVLIAGLFLALTPGSYKAVILGQLDPVLWALFGLALTVPWFRGAGFMLSGMVKLYCAWPLLLALRYEGRRVLVPAVTALTSGVVIGMLVMGPSGFMGAFADWARYMLPVVGQGTFNATNVSISFAGLRLLAELGWEYVPGPLPGWARLYLSVVGIAAPVIAAWLTRKREVVFQYAVVTCAAVLFSPLCWTTYLPLLLAPAALVFRSLSERAVPSGGDGAVTLVQVTAEPRPVIAAPALP